MMRGVLKKGPGWDIPLFRSLRKGIQDAGFVNDYLLVGEGVQNENPRYIQFMPGFLLEEQEEFVIRNRLAQVGLSRQAPLDTTDDFCHPRRVPLTGCIDDQFGPHFPYHIAHDNLAHLRYALARPTNVSIGDLTCAFGEDCAEGNLFV